MVRTLCVWPVHGDAPIEAARAQQSGARISGRLVAAMMITTILATRCTDRRFVGYEINPDYVELA